MESLAFDGYTTYSDNSSAPRTPSPNAPDFPHFHKPDVCFDDDRYRPSLLQELYDNNHGHYLEPSHDWHPIVRQEYTMVRRATFPYVRHDREDLQQHQQHHPQYYIQQQHHHMDNHYLPPFEEHDPNIKLEDTSPVMVPTQASSTAYGAHFSMVPTQPGQLPTYLSPHTGLPVQHTDDAASKETQYLRRRCFNCHTTEPPSWRRSTLNPGKIVCNKCGLYERTHLRPRPLRFDELRAGNKARKHTKPQSGSPKIKKEPAAASALLRRSSVSSSHSSANSDWDDNGEYHFYLFRSVDRFLFSDRHWSKKK